MIRKHGKPVDIARFKQALLNYDTLRAIINKNRAFGRKTQSKAMRVSRCPLCGFGGKPGSPKIFGIRYYFCRECGLYFADRVLPPNDTFDYYRTNKGYSRLSYADRKTYHYRAKEISLPKIRFVSQFLKPSQRRWLDVGSGIGDVIFNLKNEGYIARGIEISDNSLRFAKQVFGVSLESVSVSELLKEEGGSRFDVVSYFGVLEHMPFPLEELKSAFKLLAPGGILVLEVPNAMSLSVALDFCFPDTTVRQATPFLHLTLFSEQTLRYIAKTFKLVPRGIWFLGLDFFNLILHLGAQEHGFLSSSTCKKLLRLNNHIQMFIDRSEISDEIIFIAQKKTE